MTVVSIPRRWLALLVLTLLPACADSEPEAPNRTESTWTTELEYRFGDAMVGDAQFHVIRLVRVGRGGERVFVVETALSRVSVWTPEGTLLVDVGRPGEGPGDFAFADYVFPDDSGFLVRDLQRGRFSYFSADGALQTTTAFPRNVSYQGFQIDGHARFPDGSFLGEPSIAASIRMGMSGDDPIHSLPLLRIHETEDGWSHRPLWRRNIRNETLWLKLPDDQPVFTVQPFSDADRYQVDPVAGTFVLARNTGGNLGAGQAELLELTSAGDTVWQRRLQFDPVPVLGSVLDEQVEVFVGVLEHLEETYPGILGRRSPRSIVEEAVFVPEHLPAVRSIFLSSFSREVWIESLERVDTMKVWYSVVRGESETPPRRVLLPEFFHARDATETHVWGFWRDEMGVGQLGVDHVEGRRLVELGHSER